MLLLLACTNPEKESTAPDDTEPLATTWELGTSQSCDAPIEAGWTVSPAVETWEAPTSPDLPAIEPGGVAIRDDGIWFLRPDTSIGILEKSTQYTTVRESNIGEGATGFVQADLDNDGVAELLLPGGAVRVIDANGREEVLWQDETHMRFVRDIAPMDTDGDGDLDLLFSFSAPSEDWEKFRSLLLTNHGDGSFSEPITLSGEAELWGHSFDVMALDLNQDAVPDGYVCNDLANLYAPNLVLENNAGVLSPAGNQNGLNIVASCMGMSWGDIDEDGDLDAFIGDATRLWVLLNTEVGFVDASVALGFSGWMEPIMGWGTQVQDIDDDGHPELLVAKSWFYTAGATSGYEAVYQQQNGTWVDTAASFGFPQDNHGRSVVPVDLNEDGALDLVFGDGWRAPYIALSNGCFEGNWIEVVAPEGTLVEVEAGALKRVALVTHDRSFASTGPLVARIGLGSETTVQAITLHLPHQGVVRTEQSFPIRARHVWLGSQVP